MSIVPFGGLQVISLRIAGTRNFIYSTIVLTAFLQELDKRVLQKQQESKKHVPERKAREVGDCVNSCPPPQAPKWTIDSAWLEGMQVYCVLCYIV